MSSKNNKKTEKYLLRMVKRAFDFNDNAPKSSIVLRNDFVPMLISEGYKVEVPSGDNYNSKIKINGYDFYVDFTDKNISLSLRGYYEPEKVRYFKMGHEHTSKGIKSKIDHLLALGKEEKERDDNIDIVRKIAEKLQKELGSTVHASWHKSGHIEIDLSGFEKDEYECKEGKKEGINILIDKKTFEPLSVIVHKQWMDFEEYPEYIKWMLAMYLKAKNIIRNLQKTI